MSEANDSSNLYELSFLSKTEDTLKIKEILAKNKAVITKEKTGEKIRFAYPIAKDSYGFLGVFQFTIVPDFLKSIFSDLKLEGELLRYLIHKVTNKEKDQTVQTRSRWPLTAPAGEKKHRDTTLTNEALEKKIEEIMK